MAGTESRQGFILRLYLNNQDTSIYTYDLGRVTSPARPDGFQVTIEQFSRGLEIVGNWWAFVKSQMKPESEPISVLNDHVMLQGSKLVAEITVGGLIVEWEYDPATGIMSTDARPAFDMCGAGFSLYQKMLKDYLGAVRRI